MKKIRIILVVLILTVLILTNYLIYITNKVKNEKSLLYLQKSKTENELFSVKNTVSVLNKRLTYNQIKIGKIEKELLENQKTIKSFSEKENFFKYKLELTNSKINLLQNEVNDLKNKIPKKNLVWDYSNIKIPKQKINENTCVLNSIKVAFKNNKNIDVDISLYAEMTKNPIGKYWIPGLLIEDEKTGNKFLEEHNNDLFSTFRRLYLIGIQYKYTNLVSDLEKKISNKEYVLYTAPMYIFFPEESKWFSEKNKLIYHTVTIIGIDYTNKKVLYTDSLTGKIRKLDFNEFFIDNKYTKFPILYFTSYPEYRKK